MASLPPYKNGTENNMEIEFVSYGMLVDTGTVLFLDRKAYIAFLINLPELFHSVKSVY